MEGSDFETWVECFDTSQSKDSDKYLLYEYILALEQLG